MKYNKETTLKSILSTEKGQIVLRKYAPQLFSYPGNVYVGHQHYGATLETAPENKLLGITPEIADLILEELVKPDEEVLRYFPRKKSLDEIDAESFMAKSQPLTGKVETIGLQEGNLDLEEKDITLSLDGAWLMVEGEGQVPNWEKAMPAQVPGSVHTALVENGRLPDPTFAQNQRIHRKESYKTWWFKKTFQHPEGSDVRLTFGGVCNKCEVWLNGKFLGAHEGMFGGPEFDISDYLTDENELLVKLHPIPFTTEGPHGGRFPESNQSWWHTVVFNNVYGWHYSNLESLGIWENVILTQVPEVEIVDPFISARDHENGEAQFLVNLKSKSALSGKIYGEISPKNFTGETYCFEKELNLEAGDNKIHLQFRIPDPQLWWPVDLGNQNLYTLRIWIVKGKNVLDFEQLDFGIRSVVMAPLPEGPQEDQFNWTFVVNGEPHFMKGTNWCTMDPLMNFSKERYTRFLSLAAQQHVQLIRAWGSGMPETDEFYDVCDAFGIMVIQEWPTAWNSHELQPRDVLEETVRLTTMRIRNRACLVMYGGGNESSIPFGDAIDMMGRLSIELDGTRPFHRGEPWGGSDHGYPCYWGRMPLDYAASMMVSKFWGEFGVACMPVYESVLRYLPEEEKTKWPPEKGSALEYHTPIFGYAEDLSRLLQYADYFMDKKAGNLEQFTIASQLSQAVGLRHPLERARTRWPYSSGACYYKNNDNSPAASWSTVDWYGAPKIGHYFVQDAFAPLHACVLFSTLHFVGTPTDAYENDIFLLDDTDALAGKLWKVAVRAYDSELKLIKSFEFDGKDSIDHTKKVGNLILDYVETNSTPLLVVAEVIVDGNLADRTFYFLNYEYVKGSLFTLPKTSLSWVVDGSNVRVTNSGSRPAVGVSIQQPGSLDTFTVSDSFFWLEAGEIKTVKVSATKNLAVKAWNAP